MHKKSKQNENYLLNGLQNFSKDFNSVYFVLKQCKRNKNSSANYQTRKINCSTDCKTILRTYTLSHFVLKKSAKKLKIVQLITQKIICSTDYKLFKGFLLSILLLKSVKKIENGSADYQTKEIIC